MKIDYKPFLSATLPLLLLAACGGGSDGTTPVTGAAQPGGSEQTPTTANSTIVNGRVADGYVQGATVCVDVDENGACGQAEPSATTGAGGIYALEIIAEHADKPIIARITADDIDEDTGEAIGKELVLSTPPDRPDFISPITTLVHEELKGNPTLSTQAAEALVREELGLASDSDASLFTDYVASQESDDTEDAGHYRFLHQTARVVASMMDDVQDRVESAATDGGFDFASDAVAQEAMRKLVRQEVRNLLPEISRAVAEKINKQLEEESSGETISIVEEVDPNKVVESLRPADLETGVIDKIDAIRAESEVRKLAMEQLLKEGIYWIDVDCDKEQAYCYADYGHISVTGEDNTFTEEQFEFDFESGEWVKWEQQEELDPFALVLMDGQWVPVKDNEVAGSIEFLTDGGALFTTEQGKMVVYATARELDNTPVIHHLLKRDVSPRILDLVEESALFPEDSTAHRLHIKRQAEAHVLFNWVPDEFDQNAQDCARFGGNCNVLESVDANGATPILSLDLVSEGSQYGFEIANVIQHQYLDLPLNVRLSGGTAQVPGKEPVVTPSLVEDTVVEGIATWLVGTQYHEETYPAPGECIPPHEVEGPFPEESTPVTQEYGDPVQQELLPCEPPVDQLPGYCGENPVQNFSLDFTQEPYDPSTDDCQIPYPVLADETAPYVVGENDTAPADSITDEDKRIFAVSHWKTVTVQGVSMIEIGLPVAVKQGIDVDEAGSLLLIEHDGYVRRGAMLSDAGVSDQLTYSLPAFETVEPILKSFITQQQ